MSLEFANLSGSSKAPAKIMGDEMVKIRFHVPGTLQKLKDSEAGYPTMKTKRRSVPHKPSTKLSRSVPTLGKSLET